MISTHLQTNTLYGALLSLKNSLAQDHPIQNTWTKIGQEKFQQEQQQRTAIILQFKEQPEKTIRDTLRIHGLKFNSFRQEWYGWSTDLDALKNHLKNTDFNLEIID